MPQRPSKYRPTPKPQREARENSTQRGYGYAWQQYRAGFLKQHPLCVDCLRQDRTVEATVVDHVRPHRGNQGLFWDAANQQALCESCHGKKTARGE